jgi:hypothetical protein
MAQIHRQQHPAAPQEAQPWPNPDSNILLHNQEGPTMAQTWAATSCSSPTNTSEPNHGNEKTTQIPEGPRTTQTNSGMHNTNPFHPTRKMPQDPNMVTREQHVNRDKRITLVHAAHP